MLRRGQMGEAPQVAEGSARLGSHLGLVHNRRISFRCRSTKLRRTHLDRDGRRLQRMQRVARFREIGRRFLCVRKHLTTEDRCPCLPSSRVQEHWFFTSDLARTCQPYSVRNGSSDLRLRNPRTHVGPWSIMVRQHTLGSNLLCG